MAWRLIRLALILTWGVIVFVYAFPRELRPDWLSDLRRPLAVRMQRAAIRPAHAVFSGAEGDRNRHLWAARFVAFRDDGSRDVLEEWPAGMTWSTPMLVFDPLDTVWYRILGKGDQIRLSRSAETDREDERIRETRRGHDVRRMLRFWCESAFSERDGEGPSAVALDVWYASKSYRNGKVRMGAARIGWRSCSGGDWMKPEWNEMTEPPHWYVPPEEAP